MVKQRPAQVALDSFLTLKLVLPVGAPVGGEVVGILVEIRFLKLH